ncbi:hypothetical protein EV641_103210 [Rhodococcus sp. SMB37]|uniref:hypothetical protein n=1 Tax=Rhodococcus sp. SMB37 TaxID=2512213 RepID=UPI001053BC9D|nr:hypothetical protein [Rhodococcus sp. SMB37]TCN55863.1 hypothetical protein EV641_103210 [Rhodococcus sp. SMB37]
MTGWNNWATGASVTATDFVRSAGGLIGAVLVHVPGEQVRKDLLAGLAASLATAGRESVLGVEHFERTGDDRRRELARQARVIGSGITTLAEKSAVPVCGVVLRSNCEGHLWTPAAAAHLARTPNAPVLMQLYNEWLHQLVLLRDALLPFHNWEQVRLRVDEHGLRRIEDPRRAFLTDYLTRSPRHDVVVQLAAWAVSEFRVPQRAYGFRVEDGTALPSVVTGSPLHSPRGLLDWSDAADGEPTAFVPVVDDYLAIPTAEPASSGRQRQPEYMLVETGGGAGRSRLTLRSDHAPDVDLGQALRGHRYAYLAVGGEPHTPDGSGSQYTAPQVLATDGLVDFPSGTHLIDDVPDRQVLALLGKIVPHNIVLWDGRDWTRAAGAGKAGPPRVVVRVA